MTKHQIGSTSEIPVGDRKFVTIKGKSICVFNVNGEFFALRNMCPHQGAELCKGSVSGMTICDEDGQTPYQLSYIKKGEILRCPWHGWEFDVRTGKSVYDPNQCLVKSYDITVEHQTEQTQVETYPITVRSNMLFIYV